MILKFLSFLQTGVLPSPWNSCSEAELGDWAAGALDKVWDFKVERRTENFRGSTGEQDNILANAKMQKDENSSNYEENAWGNSFLFVKYNKLLQNMFSSSLFPFIELIMGSFCSNFSIIVMWSIINLEIVIFKWGISRWT